MDRRIFLRTFLHSALGASLLQPLGPAAWAAGSEQPAGGKRLIVVFLRGAVDGLSVVAPYGDPEYYRARGSIALARPGSADGGLDLDGHFALHPALAPLLPRWSAGQLAFVHASGSPDPTRSHFDAQDYMESGTPGRKSTADGWLNRLLGELPASAGALSIGPVLPRILSGPRPVAVLASGAAATRPAALDRPRISQAFDRLYDGDDRLGQSYRQGRQDRREMLAALGSDELENEMQAASNGAPSAAVLAEDARRLARLLRSDPRLRLACLAVGGWDTHARQGAGRGQLANRLQPLGHGLAALADGLGPLLDDSVIVVMSEFGRTVAENGNGGTDHGHGNVMWLLGGPVAGGKVHGRWPGLAPGALHEGRDLAVTTDFRSVLAALAERHLRLPGAQLASLFPDFTPDPAMARLLRA